MQHMSLKMTEKWLIIKINYLKHFQRHFKIQITPKFNFTKNCTKAQHVTTTTTARQETISKDAGYLHEDLGFAELVVRISKNCSTDLVRRRPALFWDWWLDAGNEDSVAVDKIGKRVADRIAGTADPNRFHHPGIAELTYAQCPIEQLQQQSKADWLIFKLSLRCLLARQLHYDQQNVAVEGRQQKAWPVSMTL